MTDRLLVLVLLFAAFAGVLQAANSGREKVLIDTDMVEGFDDGVAMLMLANAPGIDVVGVATVSGNSWAAEGAAFALRQLELAEVKNIPVAEGLKYPLRPQRHELFDLERKTTGMGPDAWVGSFGHPAPESWEAFYRERYGREPELRPDPRHGVYLIIDPSLVTEEIVRNVDVNDAPGLSYGQSLAYPSVAPAGTGPARIILEIDADKFWKMMLDGKTWGLR